MCRVSLGLKEVQIGAHDFKHNKVPLFARKLGNIYTSMCAAPKLAIVLASCYYCDVNWSYHNVRMCQVALGLKTVQTGVHNFKHNTVPLFAKKTREYLYFEVCCPETSSCASKPLLLR